MYPVPAKIYSVSIAPHAINMIEVHKFYQFEDAFGRGVKTFGRIVKWWFRK